MDRIDIPTVLLLFVITCTSIAIFFTIDAIVLKKKDRTTLMYIASKFSQALAIGMLLFNGYYGNPPLIIAHNVFYLLGFTGELYVILSFNSIRKKVHGFVFISVILVAGLYNIWNVSFHPVLTYRILVIGLFTLFIFFYFGFAMLLKKDKRRMIMVTGWVSFVFSIPWGLRTYYTLMHSSTVEILSSNVFQTPAYIGNIVFFTILPMLYLFISKEQDQHKLREQYSQIAVQNDEISQVNVELKELNATKDKFFKIMGHDLKSPIGQMINVFQLIQDEYEELTSEKILNLIQSMKETSVRGLKLLENILEWARSQTGDISFKSEPVSIAELIQENIELFEEQTESKHIQIKTSGLYQKPVLMDRNMIRTVVRNLLSNAIKFTREQGEIEISSRIEGEKLIVSIQDNGVGMSEEDCGKLFHIDAQHTTLGTNDEKGTGLGLILSKEFMDRHRGAIWIKSKPGEGSVFSFSVPLNRPQ